SGGYSPSMFDACRHAITASYALDEGVDPDLPTAQRGRHNARTDPVFELWLGTAESGKALDMPCGRHEAGQPFDAIVIDCNAPDSNICIWPGSDCPADVLQKIIYNATRANVAQTWVQGALVHRRGAGERGPV